MLAIIVCFERAIEDQTISLLRSIKRYLKIDDFTVFAIAPRAGHEPTQAAIAEAKSLGATYIPRALNSRYADYPLANKPIACDFVAREIAADHYLFLDSDTLFLNDTVFALPSDCDAGLRRVDAKNVGATSFAEPNGPYWEKLYKITGAVRRRWITPSGGGDEILEYYNSGFVLIRDPDIFTNWMQNFRQVMETDIRPEHGLFFTEQSVLAATITAMADTIFTLPNDLNYPIHHHEKLLDDLRAGETGKLRHIHYHRRFKDPKSRESRLRENGFGDRTPEILDLLHWPDATST